MPSFVSNKSTSTALKTAYAADIEKLCSMAKTALVTGATGFLGRQVSQTFKSAGFRVVGTGFTRAKPPVILKISLLDSAKISSALEEVK